MAGTGGSTLPFGPGSALWKYWMGKSGEVAAQVHKWTWLHRQLLKALVKAGVADPEHIAQGLTTNLLQAMGYHQRNGEWVRG
jgi:hypothetical protein